MLFAGQVRERLMVAGVPSLERQQAVVRWSAGIWHVTGATHLLPEAGALSQVADLAAGWFGRHFARTDAIAPAA